MYGKPMVFNLLNFKLIRKLHKFTRIGPNILYKQSCIIEQGDSESNTK